MELNIKELTFNLEIKEDGNSIEGYASTFGNIDSYGDIVMAGAFKKSLKKRMPKMLWQHDTRQIIGVWESAKEDDNGLFVKGRFVNTQLANEAKELVKQKAIDSMSIGYAIDRYEYDEKKDIRKLLDVELYETSLVTFPANDKAVITALKSEQIKTIRDFENFLRDAGYSRERAKFIASKGFLTAEELERDAEVSELKNIINKATNILKG